MKRGHNVISIDNLNNYYSIQLKKDRLEDIEKNSHDLKNNYEFINLNLQDKKELNRIFDKNKPSIIINLAAQAGVRYSIENPYSYIESNLKGLLKSQTRS